jgi:uncharacterized glyoxalase superfamily protein PhnB
MLREDATMKAPPEGWPRLSSAVYYDNAPAAIDWLCRAFGFEVRLKVEGDPGVIVHSELAYGEALIMISTIGSKAGDAQGLNRKSPRSLGGANTQSLCLYVDDVDAHCAHSTACGAQVSRPPTTSDYGEDYWVDRSYGCFDPEGHHWWFMQRLSPPKNSSAK